MSENKYPEISHLPCNNGMEGRYAFLQNVVYSHTDEKSQYLTLICPWKVYQALMPQNEKILEEKYPLIVFVQGSAWTRVDLNFELPQLVDYAKQGYIVAAVSHRNCLDGYPYPAFIQDIKCAIRFLRKNAQKYCIDENKIIIWGTSSGANIAQLVGLTAGDAEYETEEYAEYSDEVNAVVSCFAPSNVPDLYRVPNDNLDMTPQIRNLYSADPQIRQEQEEKMSPYHLVKKGKKYPPFLLMHGTADKLIYYTQMIEMYQKLYDAGADVKAYLVDGADHEGNFWSDEVHRTISEFIKDEGI